MSLRTIRRRRREGKTDYKARLALLKSGIPRIVIRRTNKYILLQAIESSQASDKVIFTASSKDLLKNGLDEKYSGSLKSIPASYLTGILMAKKLGKENEYIIDWGMAIGKKGGKICAAINGMVDGGSKIRTSKEIFPSSERIKGEHLKEEVKLAFNKLKEKLIKWQKKRKKLKRKKK